jgi:hypothetical protein
MPRPRKQQLLAAPGIPQAVVLTALDEAIERLVEQRNRVALSSPFRPDLLVIQHTPQITESSR